MNKETWIQHFALQVMAIDAAIKHDRNYQNAWQEEQFITYENALNLANQAWDRKEFNNEYTGTH